ncbi:MAG: cysteine desulfurase [Coriobacteriales bacterium]|jgi:cysteine desulfurase|nr:cysteine desulfurase [Coriobacteriales bacterium]
METHAIDIYLDHAAATPVDARVLAAMLPYFTERFDNPSAPYARGRAAKQALEDARGRLARAIGAKPANVTLTAGATEANNLAFGCVDGPVAVSAIEHESIMAIVEAREHATIPVEPDGMVTPAAVQGALTPRTELVSIALANGEIGTVQPLRAISDVVRAERRRRLDAGEETPLYLHTDATQAAGLLHVDVSSTGADLVTLSAAKIYGPKQVGLLWARDGIALRPLVLGGGQEHGLRGGTENVAGAVGFACALELAIGERMEECKRLSALRDTMQRALVERFPDAVVSGPRKEARRLPHLLHISFPGLEARRLVIALDRRGVSVGTGSACAASKMRTSRTLQAIGLDRSIADGSLRITLGRPTTEEQVRDAVDIIGDVVAAEYARVAAQHDWSEDRGNHHG